MTQGRRMRWGTTPGQAHGSKQTGNNYANHRLALGTSGTEMGGYYRPAAAGRGAGRGGANGPRNPGHAAAIASNQRDHAGTQLVPLSGQRSTRGETTSSATNQEPRDHTISGTHTGGLRLEMQKVIPSEAIENMLRRLHTIAPTKLTLQDFTTPDSNDGKSILLTLVVNCVADLRPELGEAQWSRIAAHAAVHHISYLHEAFMDGDVALELTKSFLATRPVKLAVDDLCPMDTPYLIDDTKLREYLGQLTTTPASELLRIITPFLKCFYPSDWELLEQVIRSASVEKLHELISTPGAIHLFFVNSGTRCTFAPPQWLSLSAFQEKQGEKPPHTSSQGTQDDDDDDDSVDSRDLLHPLREMRIDQQSFDTLPPEVQKKQILAVFPTRMASVIPADVFGHMIVMLSEMAATSIRGAMEPTTFHRLLGHATKIAAKEADLIPVPQIYYYRFRVQHLGKGYQSWANISAGTILQSWIKAWIPLFSSSRFTLALSKRPSERHVNAIDLSTIQDIPTLQTLEAYTYDVVRRQGNIHQFDFWIITDCPDIMNNGAHSFTRAAELTTQYQEDMRQAAIWSMKMERLPQGYIPCIFLGNSLLKDDDALIKEEIILRTGFHPTNEGKIHVEWITISTKTEHAQTMAHCILTKPEDHQLVSQLCQALQPIQSVEFPVTSEYIPLIIPPRQGADSDQELSQAIARHQEYTRALVQVSIKGVPRTSMCYYIPLDPGMELLSPEHDATIAYLLLHGTIVNTDDTRIPSPVLRVNMDSKRTRIYLHAPRAQAGELVVFARAIYRLLTRWYEKDISQATLDVRDAERIALQARNTESHLRQPRAAPTGPPTSGTSLPSMSSDLTPPSNIAGTNQQQMISVPLDQWNQAITLMQASAAKMDAMLLAMGQMPTIISHRDALDEAVSVITQSMTLNSDLVNNRADTTVMETRRTLADRINEINGNVSASNASLGSKQDQLLASISTIVQLITEVTKKLDRGRETQPLPETESGQNQDDNGDGNRDKQAVEQAPQFEAHGGQEDGLDDGLTGESTRQTTSVLEVELHTQQDEPTTLGGSADLQQDSDIEHSGIDHHEEPDVQPQADNQAKSTGVEEAEQKEEWDRDHELPESDTENEAGDSPLYTPLARCHACNKLDANIEVCDFCEIPHHFDCLIQEPNGGTNRYCNACMDFHYGTQKGVSQSSSANSDLELSEPELSSNEDSATSEFVSTTRVVPKSSTGKASQSQPSTSKYKLRERKTK